MYLGRFYENIDAKATYTAYLDDFKRATEVVWMKHKTGDTVKQGIFMCRKSWEIRENYANIT